MKRNNLYQKSLKSIDEEVSVIHSYKIDGQNRM